MRAGTSLVFFSALSLVPCQCVAHSRYSIKHICGMTTDELDRLGEALRGSVMGRIVCVSQKRCVKVLMRAVPQNETLLDKGPCRCSKLK